VTTRLHLVPRLRMCGVLASFHHSSSWRMFRTCGCSYRLL